jgi:DNA-binding Lrp family transcriptional regulator
MVLSDDEIRFLEILADGRRKTYVHVAKGFGMPVTPMSPTFTNNLANRLRKLGLVKRAGVLRDGYRITDQGLEVVRRRTG